MNITILGSTGSIGSQALEIIKELKGYNVVALICKSNVEVLDKEIQEFNPKYVYTYIINKELKRKYPDVEFFSGDEGIIDIINKEDSGVILNALVGISGLEPTLRALELGKKVLLANKETLVVGGELIKKALKEYGGILYPIDSEHAGLWELIDEYGKENIDTFGITASGGAFRDYKKEMMECVKAKDALKHPNWKMGKKITIDSATMMNKVFEIAEVHYLFDADYQSIQARINRESICHAYVKLKNGEYKYAVGEVSMRNPIIRALYYPEIKYTNNIKRDIIEFEEIDNEKYPLYEIGLEAIKKGKLYPAILNIANEASVNLFLNDEIKYNDIIKLIRMALNEFDGDNEVNLENIQKINKDVYNYIMKLKGEL